MKYILPTLFFFLTACNNNREQKLVVDTTSTMPKQGDIVDIKKNIRTDRLNGNKYDLPDSIGGKTVSFYINNPKVAPLAKALYQGRFRPEDNDSTIQLLSYVTTNDSTLRPFYRWCLDFTIKIADGALAEYPGEPALQYATEFPNEFFNYIDKDTSGQRYKEWTEIIAYSGLIGYDENPDNIQKQIRSRMMNNCVACTDVIKKRIGIFARDVADATKFKD